MRRTERIPVELRVIWNRAGRAISCTVDDINAHGIFVRTEEVVEPESLMHLRVELDGRVAEMFATARFAGHTGGGRGIGAEIFLIDDVTRCHWLDFYERLCARHAQQRKSAAMGG